MKRCILLVGVIVAGLPGVAHGREDTPPPGTPGGPFQHRDVHDFYAARDRDSFCRYPAAPTCALRPGEGLRDLGSGF